MAESGEKSGSAEMASCPGSSRLESEMKKIYSKNTQNSTIIWWSDNIGLIASLASQTLPRCEAQETCKYPAHPGNGLFSWVITFQIGRGLCDWLASHWPTNLFDWLTSQTHLDQSRMFVDIQGKIPLCCPFQVILMVFTMIILFYCLFNPFYRHSSAI